MKKYILVILLSLLFIAGCTSKVSVQEMVDEMQHYKDLEAPINMLYYEGSDAKYHYFGFVYTMFGTELYKVPREQLIIQEEKDISEGRHSIIVRKIGNLWTAMQISAQDSPANMKHYQIWQEDIHAKKEGIIILIAPPPLKKKED